MSKKSTNPLSVKEFYNSHFFKDGLPSATVAAVSIEINGEKLHIPGIRLHPSNRIADIVTAYYHYLAENNVVIPPTSEPEESKEPELINFEKIAYRKQEYMVEERAGDVFVIKNLGTGKVINVGSPVGKAVRKRYRDLND